MLKPESETARRALSIAVALAVADPGEKADARRMGPGGAALFWRQVARLQIPQGQEAAWQLFTRLVALMTPASRDKSVHDDKRPLGAAMAEAGLSEQRFARLLAARGGARDDAMERAIRMMARKVPSLDVIDLARAILWPDDTSRLRAPIINSLTIQIPRSPKMPDPRFLQIHFLAPYTAALLNRDDSGLAKRLPFGGSLRTRVSSQCLKYHWRKVEDRHSLSTIDGADDAYRSRETIDRKVFGDWSASMDEGVVKAVREVLLKAVYGDKGVDKKSRQTLLLGQVEVAFLTETAKQLVAEAAGDAKAAKAVSEAWAKAGKANLKAMSEGAKLPGGLTGALFGRMVTSDPKANIDAAVHVAHAFTVHAEEAESDYFIAADDLARDEDAGADTIQETELTSGLFYGYVVVDLPGLLDNLGGDARLAGDVLHNLLYLIAEVSPGAKLGSTAPYSRASFLLVEAGDRQPRSLAEAFRAPCAANTSVAVGKLTDHLATLDAAYDTGEARRVMSLANADVPGADRGTLADLANFAKGLPAQLTESVA